MRRIVLVLAVLSGLLCAGFVAAAVYTNTRPYGYIRIPGFYDIGAFGLSQHGVDAQFGFLERGFHPTIMYRFYVFGIGFTSEPASPVSAARGTVYWVVLPYWLLITITAVLPITAARPRHRLLLRSRRKRGLCPACGYDLRASKERCPECGTPVPAQAASSGGKA